MTRIAIVGLLGSGKTLLLTLLGKIASLEGTRVISNYHTEFSEYLNNNEFVKKIKRFEIQKCMTAIDEIATMVDSRNPPIKNVDKTYFFLQSRKKHTEVRFTTQSFIMADNRVRLVTDKVYIARHLEPLERFEYTGFLSIGGLLVKMRGEPLRIPYYIAEEIYPLYDTDEVVNPLSMITEENVDWDAFISDFEELKDVSKQAFVAYMKAEHEIITEQALKGIYDLLLAGKDEKAKKILYG